MQWLQDLVETWYREGREKGRLRDEVARDAAVEVLLGDGRSHTAKIGDFVILDGFGDLWLHIVFAEDEFNQVEGVEVKDLLCEMTEKT